MRESAWFVDVLPIVDLKPSLRATIEMAWRRSLGRRGSRPPIAEVETWTCLALVSLILDRLSSIQGALAPVSLTSKEGIEHDIALATQPANGRYGPTVVITSTSLLERLAPQCRLTFKAMITRLGQVVASAKPGGSGNFAASHGTVRSKDRYCQEHARRWASVARSLSSSSSARARPGLWNASFVLRKGGITPKEGKP